jgi:hypothetical protein
LTDIFIFTSSIRDIECLAKINTLILACSEQVHFLVIDDHEKLNSEHKKILCKNASNITLISNSPHLISNIEEKITSFQHSIGIGASDHSLSLARFTQLYFHVGPAIKNNHRKLIPLNDQYEAGLLNVLRYFSENDFEDSLVENIDLVNFIENSIKFFEQANAASILLQRHNAICLSLIDNFSEKIVAIFGTGFPFYLVNDYGEFSHGTRTPKSILDYLYSQKQYFQSKLSSLKRRNRAVIRA